VPVTFWRWSNAAALKGDWHNIINLRVKNWVLDSSSTALRAPLEERILAFIVVLQHQADKLFLE
jgi:hypothetical protein